MDDPGPQVVALVAGAASFFLSMVESALENYSGARLLEIAKKRNGDAGIPAGRVRAANARLFTDVAQL